VVRRLDHSQRFELVDVAGIAALDGGEQQLDPASARLPERLAHRCEADDLGGVDVIEADHRKVAWHAEAQRLGRLQDTDRLHLPLNVHAALADFFAGILAPPT
jgi:hypothetical protein